MINQKRWFSRDSTAELVHKLRNAEKRDRTFSRIVDDIYRYHGKCVGADFEIWGDKTPSNVGKIKKIYTSFNDVKFVNIIRDGVDVVHSFLEMGRYGNNVLKPADRWVNAIDHSIYFSNEYPSKMKNIKYEKLAKKPSEVTKEVSCFLGITYKEKMLSDTSQKKEMPESRTIDHYSNIFDKISTKSIGKGRSKLDRYQKEKIKPIINDTLKRLGYEGITV